MANKHNISWRERVFILTSALAVWAGARVLQTHFRHFVDPSWVNLPAGPKLLVGHMVIFSLVPALICGLWWYCLIYKQLLPPARILGSISRSLILGTAAGMFLALATLVSMPLLYGLTIKFHMNPWSVVGNLFSNAYEEVVYRGLLFVAVRAATGNLWAAIIFSGAAFGYVHDDYPIGARIEVGLMGSILAWIYARTDSFIAPVWAHNIADWVIDLFI